MRCAAETCSLKLKHLNHTDTFTGKKKQSRTVGKLVLAWHFGGACVPSSEPAPRVPLAFSTPWWSAILQASCSVLLTSLLPKPAAASTVTSPGCRCSGILLFLRLSLLNCMKAAVPLPLLHLMEKFCGNKSWPLTCAFWRPTHQKWFFFGVRQTAPTHPCSHAVGRFCTRPDCWESPTIPSR